MKKLLVLIPWALLVWAVYAIYWVLDPWIVSLWPKNGYENIWAVVVYVFTTLWSVGMIITCIVVLGAITSTIFSKD